jgi:hypothetical protein
MLLPMAKALRRRCAEFWRRISASTFGLRTEVRGASVSAELHSPEPLLADPGENASLLYAAQTA